MVIILYSVVNKLFTLCLLSIYGFGMETDAQFPGDFKSKCNPLFRNDVCAQEKKSLHSRSRRIIGGSYSDKRQWPWFVQIELYSFRTVILKTDKRELTEDRLIRSWVNCGGSIIHSNWVLTAAHCVIDLQAGKPGVRRQVQSKNFDYERLKSRMDGDEVEVSLSVIPYTKVRLVAGSHQNIYFDVDLKEGSQERLSNVIYVHPNYNIYSGLGELRADNDIALIYVPIKWHWSDYVLPLCISMTSVSCKPKDNGPIYIAGFGKISSGPNGGYSKYIRHTEVQYHEDDYCQKKLHRICREKNEILSNKACTLRSDKICSDDELYKQKSACDMDSGSAVFFLQDNVYWQYGIAQDAIDYGPRCDPRGINLHSSVPNFIDWFVDVVMKQDLEAAGFHMASFVQDTSSINPSVVLKYLNSQK